MLCEDNANPGEHNLEDGSPTAGGNLMNQGASQGNPNDSYNVLMREIGIDNNDGLSQAFL